MKRAAAEKLTVMTLQQWADLDEDDEGELVDGVLEEEEMPTVLHEVVVGYLFAFLRAWVTRRKGLVLGSEAKIAVGPRRGRKPDLSAFVGAVPSLDDALIRVAPLLVVEVLSPRPRDVRRDRIDKLRDYARAHVRYYWIVDPKLRLIEVLELSRNRYSTALAASTGRVKLPGLGVVLDLDALWAEVDAVERHKK